VAKVDKMDVVKGVAELETILKAGDNKKSGGVEKLLDEYRSSISGKLQKKIKFIVRLRNNILHDGYEPTHVELNRFSQLFPNVKRDLAAAIKKYKKNKAKQQKQQQSFDYTNKNNYKQNSNEFEWNRAAFTSSRRVNDSDILTEEEWKRKREELERKFRKKQEPKYVTKGSFLNGDGPLSKIAALGLFGLGVYGSLTSEPDSFSFNWYDDDEGETVWK